MVAKDHLSDKANFDLVLVEAAKKGDQLAYADLMERYRESIYFMMLKMVKDADDADDLTIEAFGKAFNRLGQYSRTLLLAPGYLKSHLIIVSILFEKEN